MILEVRDLRKSFGTKEVLKGITFSAESGEALGLLGRNGAGKTTTIRIILDVFKGNSGEILIDGKPINYDEITYGYLPEERGLYPKKKIIDQLVYFAELKGMSGKNARKAADQWLERLEMSEYRNKKPQELSKGNQQKIQLISAVIHDPDVLILDEPFSALDAITREKMQSLFLEEWEKHPAPTILITHDVEEAVFLGQRIVLLSGKPGKIVEIIENTSFSVPKENKRLSDRFYQVAKQVREVLDQYDESK